MSGVVPNSALIPPSPIGPANAAASGPTRDAPVRGPSFGEVLARQTATEPPKFSRHALDRLERRGIDMGGQTLARLAGGIDRAAGKGARHSVVFVDGTAFVVSVANNTVITAVSPEHMREHVFTNIDSAVIA